MNANEILSNIFILRDNEGENEFIDYLYDTFTILTHLKDFKTIDNVLELSIESNVHPDLMFAFLIITKPVKEKLNMREKFFKSCEKYFEENPSDPNVLYGLE